MSMQIQEILDTALQKEIEAQSIYMAMREQVDSPSVKGLLKALADEEEAHAKRIGELKELDSEQWFEDKVADLKQKEGIKTDALEKDACIEDVMLYAINEEQLALEFYSRLVSTVKGKDAKALCEELAHEELKHKVKLELMYGDLFRR